MCAYNSTGLLFGNSAGVALPFRCYLFVPTKAIPVRYFMYYVWWHLIISLIFTVLHRNPNAPRTPAPTWRPASFEKGPCYLQIDTTFDMKTGKMNEERYIFWQTLAEYMQT